MSSISSVARIAFHSSDVIVNSLPAPPAVSPFGECFATLARATTQAPLVLSLPTDANPGFTILRQPAGSAVSLTAPPSAQVLGGLLAHIAELSVRPVVLHLAVSRDLADALVLRGAVPFFLLSGSTQQAHDHALLAARLARTEGRLVVHVFCTGDTDEAVDEVEQERVRPFLLAARTKGLQVSARRDGRVG
jgi:sulfite reductase (NADPH) hemoprotein beta-component